MDNGGTDNLIPITHLPSRLLDLTSMLTCVGLWRQSPRTTTLPAAATPPRYEVGGVTAPAESAEHDIFLANRGQLHDSTLPTAPLRKPPPSTKQPPRQLPDQPAALLSVAHEA
jgi:hypothetical protein